MKQNLMKYLFYKNSEEINIAFTYLIQWRTVMGDKTVYGGYYNSAGGSTGGDIVTGLTVVDGFFLTPRASAVSASAPVFNESALPQGGTITIVTIANEVGNWMAIGSA